MGLFLTLFQVQMIGLIICGLVLRRQFPKSVHAVLEKNSLRIDGTFSRRRRDIEFVSIRHAFAQVYRGLFLLFLATGLCGLLTAGLEVRPPNFDADFDAAYYAKTSEPTTASSDHKYPFPLVLVYFVSTFMVLPQLMWGLYRRAIKRYESHATVRFRQYCNSDWMEMKESELAQAGS